MMSQNLENKIGMMFLPPSSTHFTESLDVLCFSPTKRLWRNNLSEYKESKNCEKIGTMQKQHFPPVPKNLMERFFNLTSTGPLLKSLNGFLSKIFLNSVQETRIQWVGHHSTPTKKKNSFPWGH